MKVLSVPEAMRPPDATVFELVLISMDIVKPSFANPLSAFSLHPEIDENALLILLTKSNAGKENALFSINESMFLVLVSSSVPQT